MLLVQTHTGMIRCRGQCLIQFLMIFTIWKRVSIRRVMGSALSGLVVSAGCRAGTLTGISYHVRKKLWRLKLRHQLFLPQDFTAGTDGHLLQGILLPAISMARRTIIGRLVCHKPSLDSRSASRISCLLGLLPSPETSRGERRGRSGWGTMAKMSPVRRRMIFMGLLQGFAHSFVEVYAGSASCPLTSDQSK